MKIALDARTVYTAARRGTGKNLLDLYSRVAEEKPGWEFVMIHRGEPGIDDPFAGIDNISNVAGELKGDRYNCWLNYKLPMMARAVGADILHCPANVVPRLKLVPYVMTLHDLIPLECDDRKYAKWWGKNVAAGLKKARGIITPSYYSKRQILAEFGNYDDKILINHWAPDSAIKFVENPAVITEIKKKYGITPDKEYVFGFGAADERKNTQRILKVWAGLDEKIKAAHDLVLVGMNDYAIKRFTEQVKHLKCEDSVRLHGFADEKDIPALMTGAKLMCYPSLLEGFGLPILDAFKCHTAVLTSNATSLPEVGGDAAYYVDPRCERSIAAGLTKMLQDDFLRWEMAKKGQARVDMFSWDSCVQNFIEFMEKVAKK